jgi:AraC-like DNA-binding protein
MTKRPTIVAAATSHNRQRVMRRFERVVEENLDWPLCVPDMCAMVGVADRTLRQYCQKHLGMSPRRYLWMRRMHHVRQALARADATVKTVTEISTDHGFLELGRFAATYRKLFGEVPSATLRRAADHLPMVEVRALQ